MAWFSVVYQRNYFIYSCRVFKNYRACGFVGTIFIRHFEQSRCDWLNHTMWYLVSVSTRLCAIGWTIPRGSTRIQHCPVAWNLSQYCFIFEHNTDTNMLCRLFDNRKYMDIYISLYIRNTAILENKKSVCIFPHQVVNTCDLHHFSLSKCTICRTIPVKMPQIDQLSPILKVY